MFEVSILFIFIISLVFSVFVEFSLIIPLIFGLLIFSLYAKIKKFSCRDILYMYLEGIMKVKNVVITLFIIGILTGVWRASGTISFIIFHASKFVIPQIFIAITFLLCSLISFLIGTAFGAAATMGTICMMMGQSMSIDPIILGGAILSGVYFGDRASPMSTSALLISELTNTNLFENIKKMMKVSIIPFVLTILIYIVIGFLKIKSKDINTSVADLFKENFNLSLVTIIPTIIIIIFSIFKVNVRKTMILSVLAGSLICIYIQDMNIKELLKVYIYGYKSNNIELNAILAGGGVISMFKVIGIVSISSTYIGIFNNTSLITGIKSNVLNLSKKINYYLTITVVSIFTSMMSCNQTLSIMLTHQLCDDIVDDKEKFTIILENTVVLIAPMIPWSIASAVPLATVGANSRSILYAYYLFLVPIYNYLRDKKINY